MFVAGPHSPIGRGNGLKIRQVSVRIRLGAPCGRCRCLRFLSGFYQVFGVSGPRGRRCELRCPPIHLEPPDAGCATPLTLSLRHLARAVTITSSGGARSFRSSAESGSIQATSRHPPNRRYVRPGHIVGPWLISRRDQVRPLGVRQPYSLPHPCTGGWPRGHTPGHWRKHRRFSYATGLACSTSIG